MDLQENNGKGESEDITFQNNKPQQNVFRLRGLGALQLSLINRTY